MTKGVKRAAVRPRSGRERGGSGVHRFRSFRWRGVPLEGYETARENPSSALVSRQVLIAGSRGAGVDFDVRYFEIAPEGHSRREQHEHAHWVIVLRGTGKVRIGRRWRILRYLDACYIDRGALHQLRNDGAEPFGFLCVVDSRRRPSVPRRGATELR